MFCKSQQTPRRPISPMSKFIVHASPISTPTQTQKAPVSLPSHPVTHSAAARLSCPSPSTPSLASCRHSSVSSSSAHSLAAAASSGPKSRIFAYPTLLTGGLPAGIEDDGPLSHAIRLASGWVLPSIHRPWDPLLVHGIKDRSWPSPVTGCLQGGRRARAPASLRGLPTSLSPWTRM
jgi:hypothetical protein